MARRGCQRLELAVAVFVRPVLSGTVSKHACDELQHQQQHIDHTADDCHFKKPLLFFPYLLDKQYSVCGQM